MYRSLIYRAALAATVSASFGCTAGEIEGHIDTASVDGTLLAVVEASDDMTITFWELSPGITAVRHEARTEDALPVQAAALDTAGATLEDIYLDVAPASQRSESDLFELRAADARARIRREALQSSISTDRIDDDLSAETVLASGDLLGDNYGADWFLDNYCKESKASSPPFCPTNVTWAHSGYVRAQQFTSCVMAADFESGASYRFAHEYAPGRWHIDASGRLDPRRIQCWTYNAPGRYHGWGKGGAPAQRIHFSAVFVQAGGE